jgi:hypothetical protein
MVLVELSFKVHRGFVTEGAVEPLPVVKDFDPFKDRRARGSARGEVSAMDQVAFEAAPKTFHGGVVVTVAAAAHAGNDSGREPSLPIVLTGVLDAPIGVMEQPRRWPAVGQRHVQGGHRQRGGQRVAHRPADATARATVQNSGHIKPTFVRFHIRDVGHPHRVGTQRLALAQQTIWRDGRSWWLSVRLTGR